MKTVKIKDIEIGKGMPKICIPITGKNREEILLDIEEILRQKPDLAEWRVDCYEEGEKEEKVLEMLETITDRLGQIPLLFTFRTAREGGSKEISFKNGSRMRRFGCRGAAPASCSVRKQIKFDFLRQVFPKKAASVCVIMSAKREGKA